MAVRRCLLLVLACLLVVAGAFTALLGLNALGGWLAQSLALPRGGNARLAWDLGWVAASSIAALWLVARWAPVAQRVLAWLVWAALAIAVVWGVVTLGEDFPGWFLAALLLMLPALFGLVIWLTRRPRNLVGD